MWRLARPPDKWRHPANTRRSTHSASTACDRTVRAPASRPPPERLFMRSPSAWPTGVPLRPSQSDLAA
eukprot:1859983-Prymnesium_polylepis.1